jgi:hypothetical protein
MIELGIVRRFTAHLSLASLGAVTVWAYGRSEAEHPGDLHLRLNSDDRTYWVANSGGGYIYVGGYLRDISELDAYLAFVRKARKRRSAPWTTRSSPPSSMTRGSR